jgi:DNA polymerase delta subunit 3
MPFIDTSLIPSRMLYEFHAKETAKTPKSVHATYLLIGKKPSGEHSNGVGAHDGYDTAMRSSPFMSSLPEPESTPEDPVSTTSIVLAREEELEST